MPPLPPRPVEPPPTAWVLPDPEAAGDGDIAGLGADLEPGTVLAAYRTGLFPMHVDVPRRGRTLAWWSPLRRGILPLDGLRVSTSLRKSCRRFEVRVDTAFADVIAACADERRDGRWIDDDIIETYTALHRLGWVHSVEAWASDDGHDVLVGGLYGVAVGGLFAGESMFHRRTDASKVALVGLVDRLRAGGGSLLDCQWRTPHLASLGAVEISRPDYLGRLRDAVDAPQLAL